MSGLMKDVAGKIGGGGNDEQSSGGNEGSGQKSSGGVMKQAENVGKDGTIDNDVNSFASKEGVPKGADSFVDSAVNSEVNKF